MSNQIFGIIFAGLITLISATSNLTKEDGKKTIFKSLTSFGWVVLLLSIAIIAMNIISYYNTEKEKSIIKANEITAKITIRTNTEKEINEIYKLLPKYIYARDIKIGYDNLQIDFEKESIYSGKSKSFESWYLSFKSRFVEFDKFRLESNYVEQLNENNLNGKIKVFNQINCDNKNAIVKFEISIRNKVFTDKIKCNQYLGIKLEGIK